MGAPKATTENVRNYVKFILLRYTLSTGTQIPVALADMDEKKTFEDMIKAFFPTATITTIEGAPAYIELTKEKLQLVLNGGCDLWTQVQNRRQSAQLDGFFSFDHTLLQQFYVNLHDVWVAKSPRKRGRHG